MVDLVEIARELYPLPPQAFTAARNARAASLRSDGERDLAEEVRRLRRPSVGAWVLNLLAREDAEEVEPVVELGARLREAMGVLDASELRALDGQRRALTRAVAARAAAAAREAGQPVNAQVTSAVEESLRAAMVDEPAGRALVTGLLVETFTTTGLEPVDLTKVLAVPSLVPARVSAVPSSEDDASPPGAGGDDPAASRRAAVSAARRALREAEDARTEADDDVARASRGVTRARTARLELEARRDELARSLAAAEKGLVAAVGAEEEADAALDAASARAEEAGRAVDAARSLLDTAVEGST